MTIDVPSQNENLDDSQILPEDTNLDDKSVQLTTTPPPATSSINILGVDIYQECIDGLLPCSMVNDNIVSYLLEQEKCIFPVISTFFFTALSGEQAKKKLSRYERNSTAEMFFKPHLLLDEYIFIPVNRRHHWLLVTLTPWHIILMDSLTWDVASRRIEISLIFNYLIYLTEKYSLPNKHQNMEVKVLKVQYFILNKGII
mgnify:FL=1